MRGTIKRLKDMEQQLEDGSAANLTKKEALDFQRNVEKLNKSIGGIKEMTALPDALFVVDVGYHKIAIQEANKLGIPVIGIVDTNHSPAGVDYVVPGNDDSSKAVAIYARGIADARSGRPCRQPDGNRRSRRLTKNSSKWLLKPKNSPLPNFG